MSGRVWPYKCHGPDGGRLIIQPAVSAPGALVSVADEGRSECMIVTDPAPVVAALYAAAGKPEPVILERPELLAAEVQRTAGRAWFSVGRSGETPGRVYVHTGDEGSVLLPHDARLLAAYLAAYADEVETEPDPTEVEELAKVIRLELCESIGLRPSESDRTAARAALRWMQDKQQQGSRM